MPQSKRFLTKKKENERRKQKKSITLFLAEAAQISTYFFFFFYQYKIKNIACVVFLFFLVFCHQRFFHLTKLNGKLHSTVFKIDTSNCLLHRMRCKKDVTWDELQHAVAAKAAAAATATQQTTKLCDFNGQKCMCLCFKMWLQSFFYFPKSAHTKLENPVQTANNICMPTDINR